MKEHNGGDICNIIEDGQVERHSRGDTCDEEVLDKLTKHGLNRKRRLFKNSVAKRNNIKNDQQRNKHGLKSPCKTTCKQMCTDKIVESVRKAINQQFWNLSKAERRMFVLHSVEIKDIKRRRGKDEKKRNYVFIFIKE